MELLHTSRARFQVSCERLSFVPGNPISKYKAQRQGIRAEIEDFPFEANNGLFVFHFDTYLLDPCYALICSLCC